jgi:hypothetical protein
MSENDYAAAVAEFLRKRGVTRCPTACVVATRAKVTEADRVALRKYHSVREAVRDQKLASYRQIIAGQLGCGGFGSSRRI